MVVNRPATEKITAPQMVVYQTDFRRSRIDGVGHPGGILLCKSSISSTNCKCEKSGDRFSHRK